MWSTEITHLLPFILSVRAQQENGYDAGAAAKGFSIRSADTCSKASKGSRRTLGHPEVLLAEEAPLGLGEEQRLGVSEART